MSDDQQLSLDEYVRRLTLNAAGWLVERIHPEHGEYQATTEAGKSGVVRWGTARSEQPLANLTNETVPKK